ncbi:MAG: hypothetical protein CV089_08695 [Nitrospira sp. WS110]|nr:hypothetical protein [Nitrospira sp. WS110]
MRSWVRWLPILLGAGYIGWVLRGRRLRSWTAGKRREIKRLREELASLQDRRQPVRAIETQVDVPMQKPVDTIVYRHRPGRKKAVQTTTPKGVGKNPRRSPDDLKKIFGVGPVLERVLNDHGVFWFEQVARWSQADIDKLEGRLRNVSGRITRENWVRSATEEHYKKYKQWLGPGNPTITI